MLSDNFIKVSMATTGGAVLAVETTKEKAQEIANTAAITAAEQAHWAASIWVDTVIYWDMFVSLCAAIATPLGVLVLLYQAFYWRKKKKLLDSATKDTDD